MHGASSYLLIRALGIKGTYNKYAITEVYGWM